MILVGEGAVYLRAMRHCQSASLPIDAVISAEPPPPDLLERLGCACRISRDVNAEWEFVRDVCSDGIVWSLDNRVLLRPPLLGLPGICHFNVHNGLVQRYRGLPEVGLFLAILAGETEWGTTLHEIDSGIDTGAVFAQKRIQLKPDDTFGTAMTRAVECCAELFAEQVACVCLGETRPIAVDRTASRCFSYHHLDEAICYRDTPAWHRATDLWPLATRFQRLAAWIVARS